MLLLTCSETFADVCVRSLFAGLLEGQYGRAADGRAVWRRRIRRIREVQKLLPGQLGSMQMDIETMWKGESLDGSA
jgi:hypothetical protein